MKKIIPVIIVLTLLAAIFSYFFLGELYYKNEETQYPINIVIKPGDHLHQVLSVLLEKRLIRRPAVFKALNKLKPYAQKLRIGEYSIDSPTPSIEVIRKIIRGDVILTKVTIPEGFELKNIFKVLAKELGKDEELFWKIERDKDRVKEITDGLTTSFEGYLFPETYMFSRFAEPEKIIRKLHETYREKLLTIWKKKPSAFSLTLGETMVLASIIQAETYIDEEYGMVSSVYHNRLRINMKLQADPTVQYVLPNKKRLLYKDLEVKSPYNTYMYKGLPPGPICSPGSGAFRAAIFPDTSDYLYFVANHEGKHLFSKNVNEHNRLKRMVKRMRKRSDNGRRKN